jgi:hypothetical protein
MAEPRNADALTHTQPFDASSNHVNPPDDLVAGDNRHLRGGQLAIDDMQIRATDAASGHLHSNLARSRLSIGKFRRFKSSTKLL